MYAPGHAGHVKCRACPLRCRRAFRPLSEAELVYVAGMKAGHGTLPPDGELIAAGRAGGPLYTLYDGWAMRLRKLPNGARQILDFALPGDLMGLPSALLGSSAASVEALTTISFCELDPDRFAALMREHHSLGLALLKARIEHEERADTRLTLLGRLGASERLGYLLLELRARLRARGLFPGSSGVFPLQRVHLADAVGLSRIHVMRAMRTLRDRGLAELTGNVLTIPSERNLARFSGYPLKPATARQPIL